MDAFRIAVTFRHDGYTGHNTEGELRGEVFLTTKRCHIEPIMARMNVESYQITESSAPHQTMEKAKKVPEFYFEKEGENA